MTAPEQPQAPATAPVAVYLSPDQVGTLLAQLERFHALLHSVWVPEGEAVSRVELMHDELETAQTLLEIDVLTQLPAAAYSRAIDIQRELRSKLKSS